MFRLELDRDDLAASRFVISPVHEVLEGLLTLAGDETAPPLRRWATRNRPKLDGLRHRFPMVGVLTALVDIPPHAYSPDFLTPLLDTAQPTVAEQLTTVRDTPAARVRAELARFQADHRSPLPEGMAEALDRPDIAAALGDALDAVWQELFRADWPRVRTLLEQDLRHRADQLLTTGWSNTLAGLNPSRLQWQAGAMRSHVTQSDVDEPAGLGGIMFGPTVFSIGTYISAPTGRRAVMYPARGVDGLMGEANQPGEALAGLIGHTRARVLLELDRPATTTQLARRLDAALGTVSGHLAALRAAGLLTRTRLGQAVYYERTPLGDALLTAREG